MPPMKRPASHRRCTSLPLEAVARRCGLTRRQVRRLLQQGKLPFEQVRGQLRVPVESLQQLEAPRMHLRSGQQVER